MKLKLSKKWLQAKIKLEEGCPSVEAGIPPWVKIPPSSPKQLREKYTFVKSWPRNHVVFLKVGNQSFIVGVTLNTKAEVERLRHMLGKALYKLIQENR